MLPPTRAPLTAALCAVGIVTALSGCSPLTGGSSTPAGASTAVLVSPAIALYTDPNTQQPVTRPALPATLIYAAADAIGCVEVTIDETPAEHTSTTATCALDVGSVRLFEFATAHDYSDFVTALHLAGLQGSGLIRRGPLVFAPEGTTSRDRVKAALAATSPPR